MHWLRRIYNAAGVFALLALLSLTVLVLTSALAGRGFPFTGNFTSSDQPLSFDRLVTRAPDQSVAAEEATISSAGVEPTGEPDASSGSGITAEETSPSAEILELTEGSPASSVLDVTGGYEEDAAADGATMSALPPAVETGTTTKGATTVTWESSFADFDYTMGDTVTLTVNWTVDSGAASYHGFVLKDYNPTSVKDPATGTTPTVVYPGSEGANSVDVSFEFTGLHLDKKRNIKVGTGHFKLYLTVDANGDGVPETLVGCGLNVHVEDPQI